MRSATFMAILFAVFVCSVGVGVSFDAKCWAGVAICMILVGLLALSGWYFADSVVHPRS